MVRFGGGPVQQPWLGCGGDRFVQQLAHLCIGLARRLLLALAQRGLFGAQRLLLFAECGLLLSQRLLLLAELLLLLRQQQCQQ